MYKIIYTESYIKRVAKFIKKHQNILKQYQKCLELLEINPNHPSLRLHKLQGKMNNLFSISINISYRIILEFLIMENKIVLIDIGIHDGVYY